MRTTDMPRGRFGEDPKKCPKCKDSYPRSEYQQLRNRKGGISAYCMKCSKIKANEARSEARFGGNREMVIQRDGEKCLECGIF